MTPYEQKIYAFFEDRAIQLGNSESESRTCNFVKRGLIDSVGIVDFVLFLESTFDIQFGPDEMASEALFSIATAASLVSQMSRDDPSATSV